MATAKKKQTIKNKKYISAMNKTVEIIGQFLHEEGYTIVSEDEDSYRVRYQMSLISIFPDRADSSFCNIALPLNMEAEDGDKVGLLHLCNAVNSQQKVVKAYLIEDGIVLTYEFNFDSDESLVYQIRTGLEAVVASRSVIRKCSMEAKSQEED